MPAISAAYFSLLLFGLLRTAVVSKWMASSLIAYLLVAWVGLLGITVVLWSRGIGPRLGA